MYFVPLRGTLEWCSTVKYSFLASNWT